MYKLPKTELKHLAMKNTQYSLNANLQRPKFHLFCYATSRCRDTKLSNIKNALNDLKLTLNT